MPPSAWQVSLPLIYQLSGTVWGALFWKCARHTFYGWGEYWTLECDIRHGVSQFHMLHGLLKAPYPWIIGTCSDASKQKENGLTLAWTCRKHHHTQRLPLKASLSLSLLSILIISLSYKDCILMKSSAFVELLFFCSRTCYPFFPHITSFLHPIPSRIRCSCIYMCD